MSVYGPGAGAAYLVQHHCSYPHHCCVDKVSQYIQRDRSIISQRVVPALHYITNWLALTFGLDGAVDETFRLSSQLHPPVERSLHKAERIAILYL